MAELLYIRKLDVRELLVSVILELIDHCSQHLSHRMVHTLHPTNALWVVRAGDNFPNPKKLVGGNVNALSKMKAVVREYAAWASPGGNIPVNENVRRTLSCKFGCNGCECWLGG